MYSSSCVFNNYFRDDLYDMFEKLTISAKKKTDNLSEKLSSGKNDTMETPQDPDITEDSSDDDNYMTACVLSLIYCVLQSREDADEIENDEGVSNFENPEYNHAEVSPLDQPEFQSSPIEETNIVRTENEEDLSENLNEHPFAIIYDRYFTLMNAYCQS